MALMGGVGLRDGQVVIPDRRLDQESQASPLPLSAAEPRIGVGQGPALAAAPRARPAARRRLPEDKRWAVLGHEKETVAAGYGEGFPVPMLRKWIDRIGC